MTTPVDIDKLKELLAKATPGHWCNGRTPTTIRVIAGSRRIATFPIRDGIDSQANADAICAAVNSLPALIAKAERVDAIAEALNGVIPYLDDYLRSIERIDKEVLGHVGQNLALRQAITAARNALSPKESE